MALTENVSGLLSLPAAADLSTKQFYAVDINSSGQAALCAAAGARVIGILYNDPDATGEMAAVMPLAGRKAKAIAGDTLTMGDLLATNASGKLVTAVKGTVDTSDTTGAAADPLIGSYIVGVALESAVVGDIFQFLALPMGLVPTTAA